LIGIPLKIGGKRLGVRVIVLNATFNNISVIDKDGVTNDLYAVYFIFSETVVTVMIVW
jgi:hypothetical protein